MRMGKLRLLTELRRLLVQPDTHIINRKLRNHCGKSTWEEDFDENKLVFAKNIRIYLDPRRDGPVTLVIHELLHIYMSLYLKIGSILALELEEVAILAWERKLFDYLHAPQHEKLLESWSNAIKRKLVDK